jgi:hypothetical protein
MQKPSQTRQGIQQKSAGVRQICRFHPDVPLAGSSRQALSFDIDALANARREPAPASYSKCDVAVAKSPYIWQFCNARADSDSGVAARGA